MRTFVLLLGACAALTACKTTAQSDEGRVTIEDGGYHGNGDFCPPGQAKKGNC